MTYSVVKIFNTLLIFLLSLLPLSLLKANDTIVLNIPLFGDLGRINSLDFLSQNPNIVLDITANDWGGHHNALFEDIIIGREFGDIIFMDTVMQGGVLNRVDALDFRTMDFTELNDIPDNIKSKGFSLQGELQSIPLSVGVGVLFYRNDVLQNYSASIESITRDWDSYIEFGRDLKSDNIFLINNASSIIPVIIQSKLNGSNYLYFNNSLNLDIKNQRVIKAFELAYQIYEEGLSLETGIWKDSWYNSFKENQAQVFSEINGEWLKGHLEAWIAPNNAGVWMFGSLPEGDNGTFGGIEVLIPSSTKYKNEVQQYVKYLFQDSTMIDNFTSFGMFPSKKNLYKDSVFEQESEYFSNQKIYLQVVKNSEDLSEYKTTPYDYFITEKLDIAFNKVIENKLSIDDALSEVEELTIEFVNKTQHQAKQ